MGLCECIQNCPEFRPVAPSYKLSAPDCHNRPKPPTISKSIGTVAAVERSKQQWCDWQQHMVLFRHHCPGGLKPTVPPCLRRDALVSVWSCKRVRVIACAIPPLSYSAQTWCTTAAVIEGALERGSQSMMRVPECQW
jgi:hypothetical protein